MPTPVAPKISKDPFEGMRFGITISDKRSADGERYVAFCADEAGRDAVLHEIPLIKGAHVARSAKVYEFDEEGNRL